MECCWANAAKVLNNSHNFFNGTNMTDPILYLSMLLGLIGIYTLISSFGDDDDDNGGDGERYIYNLDFAKVVS